MEWKISTLKNTVKVLGVHYSYNKKLENEKDFKNYIKDCFENLEDEKSNPWRGNHNLQKIGNF